MPTYLQLDIVGIQLGVLPCRPPFSLTLPSVAVVPDKSRRESHVISNLELLECLGNQTTFCGLYTKLTNRAIDAYVKAGRRKFAVKLHASLAALDVLVTIVVPDPSHGSLVVTEVD